MRAKDYPNPITVEGEVAKIVLYNIKGKEKGFVLIDREMVEKVNNHRWYSNKNGYAITNELGCLHHLVLEQKDGYIIDHINRDRLDNRKVNLRYVSYTLNNLNRGAKGYTFCKREGVYLVRIYFRRKSIPGGRFLKEEDAKVVAIKLRKELIEKEMKEYKPKLNQS